MKDRTTEQTYRFHTLASFAFITYIICRLRAPPPLLATTAAFSAILAFILVGRRRRKQTVSDARPQVTRRSDSRKDPFEDFRIDFSCMQQDFEPYVASGAQPLRFVLHTHAGMERLALNEVIAMPKSMDAVQLFGKVAFSLDTAGFRSAHPPFGRGPVAPVLGRAYDHRTR